MVSYFLLRDGLEVGLSGDHRKKDSFVQALIRLQALPLSETRGRSGGPFHPSFGAGRRRSAIQPTKGGSQHRLAAIVSRAVQVWVVGLNPAAHTRKSPRGTSRRTRRLTTMTGSVK
jgi:hypothetical protein